MISCGAAGGYEVLSHEAYADKIGRRTLRDDVLTCAVEPCAVEPCAVGLCATECQPHDTRKNLGRLTLSDDEPPLPTEASFS